MEGDSRIVIGIGEEGESGLARGVGDGIHVEQLLGHGIDERPAEIGSLRPLPSRLSVIMVCGFTTLSPAMVLSS